MRFDFAVILIYCAVSAAVVGAAIYLSRLLAPQFPNRDKDSTYECGERPIGSGWFSFNPRFYLMALVFIVFDVEIALTFPVATVVRSWVAQGKGLLAVGEIVLFLVILAVGLAYVWGRGDLDWVRDIRGPLAETGSPESPCGGPRGEGSE